MSNSTDANATTDTQKDGSTTSDGTSPPAAAQLIYLDIETPGYSFYSVSLSNNTVLLSAISAGASLAALALATL